MNVKVREVIPSDESVWLGKGQDETGRAVTFAGDCRAMSVVFWALRRGEPDVAIEAEVASWQILAVRS